MSALLKVSTNFPRCLGMKRNKLRPPSFYSVCCSKVAQTLAVKGISVMVSNAAHPPIKQQYDGLFYKTELERNSLIAANPSRRTKFTELLISSFPVRL